MSITMRAIPVLSLVLLAGCATAVRQPEQAIFQPRVEILHVNGTFEPVVFAIDRARMKRESRESRMNRDVCQPNDRMPVALRAGPVPMTPPSTMPNAGAAQPPYMPNLCPVTAAPANRTVITSVPLEPKTVPLPAPSEQP